MLVVISQLLIRASALCSGMSGLDFCEPHFLLCQQVFCQILPAGGDRRRLGLCSFLLTCAPSSTTLTNDTSPWCQQLLQLLPKFPEPVSCVPPQKHQQQQDNVPSSKSSISTTQRPSTELLVSHHLTPLPLFSNSYVVHSLFEIFSVRTITLVSLCVCFLAWILTDIKVNIYGDVLCIHM